MKILIAGVSGFIATNLVEYYLARGSADIIGISKAPKTGSEIRRIESLSAKSNGRFTFRPCNLRDSMQLKSILDKEMPDLIIDLAARSSVPESFIHPYEFYKDNVETVVNLVEWLRHSSPSTRAIYFSTEAVLTATGSGAAMEHLNPMNPYAASKAAAEQYVHAYNGCFDEKIQIVRPTNDYGPYQMPNRLIAKVIVNCLNKNKFRIYREALPPTKRWWTYVEDTCAAVDLISSKGEPNGVYDIVPKDRLCVEDVVHKILKMADCENLLEGYMEKRALDKEAYVLDSAELSKLGWKPKYSINKGLEKTFEWYKKNLNLF